MIAGRSVARLAVRAAAAAACALLLCGCNTDQKVAAAPEISPDYRLRHPITLQEAEHSMEVFIGSNRGELNPTQRAEVLSFGLGWKRQATGGVIVERPIGASNEAASADAMREVLSILAASGLPQQSIVVRTYPAGSNLATIRVSYPKIVAQAGPCGVWPANLGPSMNRDYTENQPYWNFGCAHQHNLAAMVDNPADLVQPRGETATYTPRRTVVIEKYRTGENASTAASSGSASAKISDVGK
jgi:pilus assembly protein CpaD